MLALSLGCSAAGCAGPRFSAPIEGLPVCPDFTTGNAKMEGGLHFPVRLRIFEGKVVLFETLITGLRHPDDPKPRTYLADDSVQYRVEWAQCANPRATRPAGEAAQGPKGREATREGAGYECGEVNVYKGDGVLQSRKGDKSSHVVTFVPPPNAACWVGESAPTAGAGHTAGPDAGTGAVASPPGGAAPESSDAGAATIR